jgi:plastocyanin
VPDEKGIAMANTNRRNLLKIAAVGSAGVVGFAIRPEPASAAGDDGALSNATVSFGAWMTNPALDRFPNSSPTATAGHHVMIPNEVTIKAGGTVNFIISGLHQVVVYDGRQPTNINTALTVPSTGTPPGLPLISDPHGRIYRGPDPTLLSPERVEVVHFATPGTYLVICGILFHFQAGMFGFVRVLP